ncbi:Imm52 family immunity protein [Rhizobium sp. 2YAF20]|uniref:Imm52 family immunity protein n=1 Tax=Rhizobium sp. 2YAF20 TaxID=3233027 RepID=UPI003F95D581
MERYFAAAYWPARKETVDECTERTSRFLGGLATISDAFSGWRQKAGSRKGALAQKVIAPDATGDIRALLENGRNRRDIDRSIIEELGFGIGLWNSRSETEAMSLSIHCGLYTAVGGLSNSVDLRLPYSFDTTSGETVLALMRSFAESWEPERVILTTSNRNREEFEKARGKGKNWEPFLDVALYLEEPLAHSFRTEELGSVRELTSGRIFLSRSLSHPQ